MQRTSEFTRLVIRSTPNDLHLSGRFEFEKRVSARIAVDGFQPISSWPGQAEYREAWVRTKGVKGLVASNPHANSSSYHWELETTPPLLLYLSIIIKKERKTKRQKGKKKKKGPNP